MVNNYFIWSFPIFTKWHERIIEQNANNQKKIKIHISDYNWERLAFSLQERILIIRQSLIKNLSQLDSISIIRDKNEFKAEDLCLFNFEDLLYIFNDEWENISEDELIQIVKNNKLNTSKYINLQTKSLIEWKFLWQNIIWITWVMWSWKSYITHKLVKLAESIWIEAHDIDLDKIWHYILEVWNDEYCMEIRKSLVELFWKEIQNNDWFVDRKKIAELVFDNSSIRKKLNEIMFRWIIVWIHKNILDKKWIIFINWALLAEFWISEISNNKSVIIWVNKDIQRKRLAWRWLSSKQIETRLKSQLNTEEKIKKLNETKHIHWYWENIIFQNDWANNNDIDRLLNNILIQVDRFWDLRIKSIFNILWKIEKYLYFINKVKNEYDKENRYYHNWSHIISSLNELYEIKHIIKDEDFLNLFFWIIFHDIIYKSNTKKWNNEIESANYAEKIIKDMDIKELDIFEIKRIIILTIDHKANNNDIVWNLMLDIDMAILWKDEIEYYAYKKSIRAEYSEYNENEYINNRLIFLKSIIKRERIFKTQYFFEKYENQARINITKEICELESIKY